MGNCLGMSNRKEYQGQTDLVSECLGTQLSLSLKISPSTSAISQCSKCLWAGLARLGFLNCQGLQPLCAARQGGC